MYKDLKYLVGGSSVAILALLAVMFFSPLSLQFADEGGVRGGVLTLEIDELIGAGRQEQALRMVDSLIEAKSKNLPSLAYFDRYLSEDEQYEVANSRADIYDLQWKRIQILGQTNQTAALRKALKRYANVIGYNREAAEAMLKHLDNR
ncbi:MAG: hypothetical protein IKT53_08885 [Bacteroidaceae bacterium]|nr:hypothetical protein [Bacteroidaceae bacterium]